MAAPSVHVAPLQEREQEAQALAAAVDRAAQGQGSVALICGEAGIGKSSVVAAMRHKLPGDARFLLGRCDDLSTPRTLGPLRDLASATGSTLAVALRRTEDREGLFAALIDEMSWPGHPTILVLEDVHWADEATLDVLRYLLRRVPDLPALLVLTYRDPLDSLHPLRGVLEVAATQVPRAAMVRLPLRPLSVDAVAAVAAQLSEATPSRSASTRDDVVVMHSLTGGNPFFVHELLASSSRHDHVPATVVDSVLARLGRLPPEARGVVELLSVVTHQIDPVLLDALLPEGSETATALACGEEHGLLTVAADSVAFRHELTRRAVSGALPGARRGRLNALVLRTLESRSDADPAELVHHAVEARDVAALLRHGPGAAREASAAGAHREALRFYGMLLAHADRFGAAERAELLQASAIERYLVGDRDRTGGRGAIAEQEEAVALWRTLGDPVALGTALRWLSRLCWWFGRVPAAQAAGREAIALLADRDGSGELGLALSNAAQLAMLASRNAEAAELAQRALALAEQQGDVAVRVHSLNNLGTARWAVGDTGGRLLLEESLRLAKEAGLNEHVTRGYCNLVYQLLLDLELRDASHEVERAIDHAERSEHLMFSQYLHVLQGWVALLQGRWEDAERAAAIGLDGTPHIRCTALAVTGRVAVRRGDDVGDALDEARTLALHIGELMRIAPTHLATAEAAWLAGDLDAVARAARPVFDLASGLGVPGCRAEAAYWLAEAGEASGLGDALRSDPWAHLARGDWRRAAAQWRAAGCPYEEALARASSEREEDLVAALTTLDALGAVPLAGRVRARMRGLGMQRIPRGPTATTRAQVAGLTGRQLDVLALLDDGLTNPEIAERLVLSVRTVDHHVAAVLEKLGAGTRRAAGARARELGWRPEST